MEKNHILVGKVITKIHLADDGGAIRFDVEGGDPIIARADGDCCSHSWVEGIQGLDQILNSPVVSVQDVSMPEVEGNKYGHYEESMTFYGCKITTEKGYGLIDYRNSSNGYYGGNLLWGDDDYFYGGVHGQNESSMNWKEVVE